MKNILSRINISDVILATFHALTLLLILSWFVDATVHEYMFLFLAFFVPSLTEEIYEDLKFPMFLITLVLFIYFAKILWV